MKAKLQIFISSTYVDLQKERQMLVKAILEMGHIPAGMEYFASEDKSQLDVIKRWIDDSDAFILMVGGRYGTIDETDSDKRSYTHIEYEYAISVKKPIRIIMLSEEYLQFKKINNEYSEEDLKSDLINNFRNKLNLSNTVNSIEEINGAAKTVINSIYDESNLQNAGWIAKKNVSLLLDLHHMNANLATRLYKNYYVYYYSTFHQRYIISKLLIGDFDKKTIAFKNDICNPSGKGEAYCYFGIVFIDGTTLYAELGNKNSDEKVYLTIKMPPKKLDVSIGILLAQSTIGQPIATTFIISKGKISNFDAIDEFRKIQKLKFNELEKLLVDDDSLHLVSKIVNKYM